MQLKSTTYRTIRRRQVLFFTRFTKKSLFEKEILGKYLLKIQKKPSNSCSKAARAAMMKIPLYVLKLNRQSPSLPFRTNYIIKLPTQASVSQTNKTLDACNRREVILGPPIQRSYSRFQIREAGMRACDLLEYYTIYTP